jgi:hypothetical protein
MRVLANVKGEKEGDADADADAKETKHVAKIRADSGGRDGPFHYFTGSMRVPGSTGSKFFSF